MNADVIDLHAARLDRSERELSDLLADLDGLRAQIVALMATEVRR